MVNGCPRSNTVGSGFPMRKPTPTYRPWALPMSMYITPPLDGTGSMRLGSCRGVRRPTGEFTDEIVLAGIRTLGLFGLVILDPDIEGAATLDSGMLDQDIEGAM